MSFSSLFVDVDAVYAQLHAFDEVKAQLFMEEPEEWFDTLKQSSLLQSDQNGCRFVTQKAYVHNTSFLKATRQRWIDAGFEIIESTSYDLRRSSSEVSLILDVQDLLSSSQNYTSCLTLTGRTDISPLLRRIRGRFIQTGGLVLHDTPQFMKVLLDQPFTVDTLFTHHGNSDIDPENIKQDSVKEAPLFVNVQEKEQADPSIEKSVVKTISDTKTTSLQAPEKKSIALKDMPLKLEEDALGEERNAAIEERAHCEKDKISAFSKRSRDISIVKSDVGHQTNIQKVEPQESEEKIISPKPLGSVSNLIASLRKNEASNQVVVDHQNKGEPPLAEQTPSHKNPFAKNFAKDKISDQKLLSSEKTHHHDVHDDLTEVPLPANSSQAKEDKDRDMRPQESIDHSDIINPDALAALVSASHSLRDEDTDQIEAHIQSSDDQEDVNQIAGQEEAVVLNQDVCEEKMKSKERSVELDTAPLEKKAKENVTSQDTHEARDLKLDDEVDALLQRLLAEEDQEARGFRPTSQDAHKARNGFFSQIGRR